MEGATPRSQAPGTATATTTRSRATQGAAGYYQGYEGYTGYAGGYEGPFDAAYGDMQAGVYAGSVYEGDGYAAAGYGDGTMEAAGESEDALGSLSRLAMLQQAAEAAAAESKPKQREMMGDGMVRSHKKGGPYWQPRNPGPTPPPSPPPSPTTRRRRRRRGRRLRRAVPAQPAVHEGLQPRRSLRPAQAHARRSPLGQLAAVGTAGRQEDLRRSDARRASRGRAPRDPARGYGEHGMWTEEDAAAAAAIGVDVRGMPIEAAGGGVEPISGVSVTLCHHCGLEFHPQQLVLHMKTCDAAQRELRLASVRSLEAELARRNGEEGGAPPKEKGVRVRLQGEPLIDVEAPESEAEEDNYDWEAEAAEEEERRRRRRRSDHQRRRPDDPRRSHKAGGGKRRKRVLTQHEEDRRRRRRGRPSGGRRRSRQEREAEAAAAREADEADDGDGAGIDGFDPSGEPLVTEADGVWLHLSEKNKSGYTGVVFRYGRYESKCRVSASAGIGSDYLGSFDTAVQAAVAYAKARLAATEATEARERDEAEREAKAAQRQRGRPQGKAVRADELECGGGGDGDSDEDEFPIVEMHAARAEGGERHRGRRRGGGDRTARGRHRRRRTYHRARWSRR